VTSLLFVPSSAHVTFYIAKDCQSEQ